MHTHTLHSTAPHCTSHPGWVGQPITNPRRPHLSADHTNLVDDQAKPAILAEPLEGLLRQNPHHICKCARIMLA